MSKYKTPWTRTGTDTLALRTAAGCKTSWGALDVRVRSNLFRIAAYETRDPNKAEELAQDYLAEAPRRLRNFRGDGPARAYMGLSVKRDARSRRRREAREVLLDPDRSATLEERPSTQPGPEEVVLGQDIASRKARALTTALAELGQKHRETARLRYIEKKKYAEIAATLGIAEGTVMSRLHKIKLHLGRRLPQIAPDVFPNE